MNEPVGSTPKPAFPPHISASWLQAFGLNYAGFIVSAASEAILEAPNRAELTSDLEDNRQKEEKRREVLRKVIRPSKYQKKAAEYRAFLMRELYKHYSSMK